MPGDGDETPQASGDGTQLLWTGRRGEDGTTRYRVTDFDGDESFSDQLGYYPGSLSFDGSQALAAEVSRRRSVVVAPIAGGPGVVVMDGLTCTLLGWTEAGQLFIRSTDLIGDSEETGYYLVDPDTGTLDEVSIPSSWRVWFIHPDGRHVFLRGDLREVLEDPSEEGVLYGIGDLETGIMTELRGGWSRSLVYGPGGVLHRDGQRFIYSARDAEGRRALYAVDPGEEPERIWVYPEETESQYSSTVGVYGDRVAWIRTNWEIGQMRPDTWGAVMVTDLGTGETTELFRLDGSVGSPQWSHDGTKIAAYYGSYEGPEGYLVIELDEGGRALGEVRHLPPGSSYGVIFSQWTPDDQAIVSVGFGPTAGPDLDAWLLPIAPGGAPIPLTADEPGPVWEVSISLDGSRFAYTSEGIVGSSIWRVTFPGGS